jgi:hypothetical protein
LTIDGIRPENSGSHRTRRWSKGDSNSRSHRERSGHGRAPHTNHRTIARERSLSFRHLSSTARGTRSSDPLCSSVESANHRSRCGEKARRHSHACVIIADIVVQQDRPSGPWRRCRRHRASWRMRGGPMSKPASRCSAPTAACSRTIFRSTRAHAAIQYCSTRPGELVSGASESKEVTCSRHRRAA